MTPAGRGRKPVRGEQQDQALTSAEKKLAKADSRSGAKGKTFLGSEIRKIGRSNT